jgi:hypothetical protein
MPEPCFFSLDEVASHLCVAKGPVHRWTVHEPPAHRAGRCSSLKLSKIDERGHASGAVNQGEKEPTR